MQRKYTGMAVDIGESTGGQTPFTMSFPPTPLDDQSTFSTTFFDYFMKGAFIVALLVFVAYKGGRKFCFRFFYQPPNDYIKDIIKPIADSKHGKLKESKIGVKKSSVRRRLVMAGFKPQLYSTVPLITNTNGSTDSTDSRYEKLRLARIDIDPESHKLNFLENLKAKEAKDSRRRILFGFFHPYSDGNGGGERVLWDAVYATLRKDPRFVAVVYTFTSRNDKSVSTLLSEIKMNFGVNFFENELNDRIVFIQLPNKYRWLINGSSFKFLTIIGQALGSIAVFWMAVYRLAPDVFIDTLGLPFTYPFASFFLGIPVISYTHYPLVSGDMLNKLNLRRPYDIAKYAYWRFMMKLYEICGAFTSSTVCNSTWTANHIKKVWKWIDKDTKPAILYPSSGLDEDKIVDPVNSPKEKIFLFLAQFRPEKRHELLIREYAKYLRETYESNPYDLVLMGSTRSVADEANVEYLQNLVDLLSIANRVTIRVNAPRQEVDHYLSIAEFGLDPMWNEHFGITVVEYMFNGMIPIVHASAGPLLDIVVPFDSQKGEFVDPNDVSRIRDGATRSGFFFKDPSDPDYGSSPVKYDTLSHVFLQVSDLSPIEKQMVRQNAVNVAHRKFGKRSFGNQWDLLLDEAVAYEMKFRSQKDEVEQLY